MRKIQHDLKWGISKYYSDKGMISLINLTKMDIILAKKLYEKFPFEIYCLDGDLLEDIERFPTIEEAEKTIKKLLD